MARESGAIRQRQGDRTHTVPQASGSPAFEPTKNDGLLFHGSQRAPDHPGGPDVGKQDQCGAIDVSPLCLRGPSPHHERRKSPTVRVLRENAVQRLHQGLGRARQRDWSRGSLRPGPPLAAITRFGQTEQTFKQCTEVRPDILRARLGARVSRGHLRSLPPRRADALEKLNALVDQILKTIDWWRVVGDRSDLVPDLELPETARRRPSRGRFYSRVLVFDRAWGVTSYMGLNVTTAIDGAVTIAVARHSDDRDLSASDLERLAASLDELELHCRGPDKLGNRPAG